MWLRKETKTDKLWKKYWSKFEFMGVSHDITACSPEFSLDSVCICLFNIFDIVCIWIFNIWRACILVRSTFTFWIAYIHKCRRCMELFLKNEAKYMEKIHFWKFINYSGEKKKLWLFLLVPLNVVLKWQCMNVSCSVDKSKRLQKQPDVDLSDGSLPFHRRTNG